MPAQRSDILAIHRGRRHRQQRRFEVAPALLCLDESMKPLDNIAEGQAFDECRERVVGNATLDPQQCIISVFVGDLRGALLDRSQRAGPRYHADDQSAHERLEPVLDLLGTAHLAQAPKL